MPCLDLAVCVDCREDVVGFVGLGLGAPADVGERGFWLGGFYCVGEFLWG